MVAVPLLKGSLDASDYEDAAASDPRIDALRSKMEVVENETFTREYLDPAKRSIGNAVQVFFNDGTSTERIQVDYPIGHRRRRAEGIPVLLEKFDRNLRAFIPSRQADQILALFEDKKSHSTTSISRLMDLLAL
jgi:2-methylcitrate dehydratase PrpD